MNVDKTYIYDERPDFVSYNAASFPYMGMPMQMMPVAQSNTTCQNNDNNLENRISSLENRVSKLESSLYPKAMDTSTYSYQNSLNIM